MRVDTLTNILDSSLSMSTGGLDADITVLTLYLPIF